MQQLYTMVIALGEDIELASPTSMQLFCHLHLQYILLVTIKLGRPGNEAVTKISYSQ